MAVEDAATTEAELRLIASSGGRLNVSDVRRAQVVAAARRLIAEQGVQGVTIARIAAAMKVSRGVINYHFANKEDILRAALNGAVRDASRDTDQLVSASQDLGELIRMVVELVRSPESDWWPIYLAFLAQSRYDKFYKQAIAAADQLHRSHLNEALGSDARAGVVLALMKGLALQAIVDPDFSIDKTSAEAAGLLSEWMQ